MINKMGKGYIFIQKMTNMMVNGRVIQEMEKVN